MTELHVRIPDDVAERLAARAEAAHTTPEDLASEAVRSFVETTTVPTRSGRLSFIGIGKSGRSDISERNEEILRAEFGG